MSQYFAISDEPQGSEVWHKERLGCVTMSRLGDVMTNGRGKDTMGQTAFSYMYDLVAEALTGEPQDKIDLRSLQWGKDNEPQARSMYSFVTGHAVQQVGFLKSVRMPRVGGSPDGLIYAGDMLGGVEIKCPLSSRIHLKYMTEGGVPDEYRWQVQGLMWLTKASWWDFVSFDPRMPDHLKLFVHRATPDLDMHDAIEERVPRFIEQLEIKLRKLLVAA